MAETDITIERAAEAVPAPGDVLLSVRGLSLDFGGRRPVRRALDRVTLDVRRGETVGLVGESGSGKSLLALAIIGLLRPPARVVAGQVLFEGRDLRGLPDAQLDRIRGRRIALIPQDASLALNPVLTVGEQLAETIRRHRPGGAREVVERSRATLRRVGLPDPERVLRAYAGQLSGGMKQRVAIALALSCDPDLPIADDPTSAVDVTIQAQILADHRQLTDRLGVATLFISHDLRVVSTLCSRVVALYAGQVVEVGTTGTLVARPAHPYTEALVACTPTVTERVNPLPVITGSPAGATLLPGCRFHPRCPRAVEPCSTKAPPLEGGQHLVACWNPVR
jgi:peptide/nickel transport system ATP-binding protein